MPTVKKPRTTLTQLRDKSATELKKLKARRAPKPPTEKLRTESQQDKIVELSTQLGYNARSISARLRHLDTQTKARDYIKTLNTRLNEQEPPQSLYIEDAKEAWDLEAEDEAEQVASRLTGKDYTVIITFVAGMASGLTFFALGWVARG